MEHCDRNHDSTIMCCVTKNIMMPRLARDFDISCVMVQQSTEMLQLTISVAQWIVMMS